MGRTEMVSNKMPNVDRR